MSYRRVLQIFFIFLSLSAASHVQASTVEKLSFDRLIGEADLIVRGRVDDIRSRQASDRRSMTTVVSIAIERQFKGPKVTSVTIEQSGGTLGDVSLGIPGLAEFTSGEDVILFLKRQRGGTLNIVGAKQGKFAVKIQPGSHNEVVEDFAHRTESLDNFLARLTTMTQKGG